MTLALLTLFVGCSTDTDDAPALEEPLPPGERGKGKGKLGNRRDLVGALPGGPEGRRGELPGGPPGAPEADLVFDGTPAPGDTPPLHFFYTVHAHLDGYALPYDDAAMKQLNAQKAANMLAIVEGIAEVAQRYDVKVTWELVEGTARGLPAHEGTENHCWKKLAAKGDEIGLHTHDYEQIQSGFRAVQEVMGRQPTVGSGMMAAARRAGESGALGSLNSQLQLLVDLGITAASDNLAPGAGNPLTNVCDSFGDDNDSASVTGNHLFPWRPNLSGGNACQAHSAGKLVLVDHVDATALFGSRGRMPSVLGPDNFATLQTKFDAALAYMEHHKPDRTAAWGFVTHLTEYTSDKDGTARPEASALAALDDFFAHVDAKRKEGRVTFSTVSEIAAEVP